MATEKVSVFRKYHGCVPTDSEGQPLSKSEWPRKRSFRWAARWFGSDGTRYSKSFESRKEAERFAEARQSDARVGKADQPRSVTLEEFARMYLEIRGDLTLRSRSEHERTLEFLKDHFGNRRLLGKITPLEARRFVAWYRQRKHRDRSPATATVNKLVRECRRIFREAVECSLIRENPFHQIRQERVGQAPWHFVSPEEFRMLTAASSSLRWRGMITLAYCCGLRISEILNLTWLDVDFERSYLRVIAKRGSEGRAAWTPKDKDARVLPISKDAVDVLTELHLKALPGQQYVFVNSKGPAAGDRVKRQNTWREFGAIRRKAKLPKFTFHDLRRSFCTNLAGAVPLHVVQELAGHSDIRTTRKHYLQVRQELIETAREALDRVMQR